MGFTLFVIHFIYNASLWGNIPLNRELSATFRTLVSFFGSSSVAVDIELAESSFPVVIIVFAIYNGWVVLINCVTSETQSLVGLRSRVKGNDCFDELAKHKLWIWYKVSYNSHKLHSLFFQQSFPVAIKTVAILLLSRDCEGVRNWSQTSNFQSESMS